MGPDQRFQYVHPCYPPRSTSRHANLAVIFWVKSYNVTGKPLVFSVAEINIIPLGVGRHPSLPLLVFFLLPTDFVDQPPDHLLYAHQLVDLRQPAQVPALAGHALCQLHGHYFPDRARCHSRPPHPHRLPLGPVLPHVARRHLCRHHLDVGQRGQPRRPGEAGLHFGHGTFCPPFGRFFFFSFFFPPYDRSAAAPWCLPFCPPLFGWNISNACTLR